MLHYGSAAFAQGVHIATDFSSRPPGCRWRFTGEVGATHYDSFNASDELNAATSPISPLWDYVLACIRCG